MWDAKMAQEVAHRSQNSLKDMLYNQLKVLRGMKTKILGKIFYIHWHNSCLVINRRGRGSKNILK